MAMVKFAALFLLLALMALSMLQTTQGLAGETQSLKSSYGQDSKIVVTKYGCHGKCVNRCKYNYRYKYKTCMFECQMCCLKCKCIICSCYRTFNPTWGKPRCPIPL